MSLAKELLDNFNKLPIDSQKEVIDFVMFLSQKEQKKLEKIMDDIIENNKEALEELGK
ncbi:DUF2281 domain-containing protein [Paramaledivibacter caminithermalis]|jgi:Asp-tRNA(Asn)/Glu-tRNA(Gln) amidotransferase B subunit|uniref:Uncharacterized protein n=1 Tax=Paramaledivibacter caminithermalis (strain DSM 15212 / CIP 107654 / DViRD3) TaxID=1121301 RepID=A0A1M6QH94_PARC5|nr:DUF2281 domain-containing protein [Paramaledivibacter caminithermalis]SHK19619.1 Protein of unknown function [Paramaledivibacter caminithermalis DSM 15212]